MTPRLIRLEDGLEVWATSSIDARFLHTELFTWRSYGSLTDAAAPTVVDLGANIGLFTLLAKRASPGARVIAVEPVPELVEALHRNVDRHGLTDVEVIGAAVGAERGEVVMTHYPLRPSGSTLHPDMQQRLRESSTWMPERVRRRMYASREVRVPSVPVAEVLPDGVIDVLKVDVVGSEEPVLRAVPPPVWDRVARLLVDVQDLDGRLDRVRDLAGACGFTVRVHQSEGARGDGLNYVVDAVR